jgi:8-oxo-dGTP pyrophosphatase MutT (NUDIX family)
MSRDAPPHWLSWAREIQALAQSGLAYSRNEYERIRYERLIEIAAEIVETHTDLPAKELLASLSMQPGYATPKVDVRGAVVREGQILLVQERSDGSWCMPGGWADVGDLPSEVAAREVWEESGFVVVPHKVVGVYDANRGGRPLEFYHAYKIVFLCEITGGYARASHETLDVGFFDFADLPPLSQNRTSKRHLSEVLAHLHDPQRPAAYD